MARRNVRQKLRYSRKLHTKFLENKKKRQKNNFLKMTSRGHFMPREVYLYNSKNTPDNFTVQKWAGL